MTKTILRTFHILVLFAVLAAFSWAPARAEEMTCPEHLPVLIDIKPGSDPNTINLSK
jgi:hypothetical protein